MSRVVTSADIDALNRVIRRQGIELGQTNERVARLERLIAEKVLTPAPTVPPPPPVEGIAPATPVQPLVAAYGADLRENVIAREALMVLGAGQQQPEADKQGGPALNKLVEPSADPYALVAEKVFTDSAPAVDGYSSTDSAPAADAGAAASGE